ncbi:PrsW family intramembrane metalloprotease [Corynebacterium striatum]|uniref:PrsW family intramembrane metalloprotease n=1 Tax=Corynebacterium striatum TaxID=43770 RepID=UPI0014198344|nr:PrsW family intramembrane metalloprotease [Corynebacterium striatum]NHY09852.1 PrsW family intramembrane metalloprotease [Corynebacterium striatum]NHY35719.1 PrsW family intramembrane metalloprotease [Corynebacterium striatum]HAT1130770.1 PrsW family intramembrane metalloprotease [Corynebacterium striatum]HAT1138554.1 PrsW family intramembrane metalloprotease [Corynebacterium striatum]HAT1141052.1 PrsW family intramembrane metalloprotease [Corynebacterium striatum]
MSKLFRNSLWVLLSLGIVSIMVNLISHLLIAPALVVPSVLIGGAYVALVLFLLRLSPMFPARGWVWAALLWGGGTAVGMVLLSSTPLMTLASSFGWQAATMSWAGAYPEEISKAAGVFFILLSFRQLNRPWHGWVVGATVGLGFETLENVLYSVVGGTMHPLSDWTGMFQMWGVRLIAGPALHILFTALAGWGIGWALYSANKTVWWRLGSIFGFLLLAFGLHFCWNYLPENTTLIPVQYVLVGLVLYPLNIYLVYRGNKFAREDTTYSVMHAGTAASKRKNQALNRSTLPSRGHLNHGGACLRGRLYE